MSVRTPQWPWGAASRACWPGKAHPYRRIILVVVAASSANTRCSEIFLPFLRHPLRFPSEADGRGRPSPPSQQHLFLFPPSLQPQGCDLEVATPGRTGFQPVSPYAPPPNDQDGRSTTARLGSRTSQMCMRLWKTLVFSLVFSFDAAVSPPAFWHSTRASPPPHSPSDCKNIPATRLARPKNKARQDAAPPRRGMWV